MNNNGHTIGAALVVGGGIGGMQAALDLAESGIKVFLVENKSSIGGVMSQLDKTFPTNDCAMCTIAPRLVDIGRHKDIDILTLCDVEKVEGRAGHFTVTLTRRARYVDESKCTGCGICFAGCPVYMENGYDLGLSERKAISTLFPQAVPNKAAIDKRQPRPCNAACMDRCPVHTNVLGYVKLIAEGKFTEAYLLARNVNPFPSVCGRVCYAPCEEVCNRGQLDQPVAIRELKMFAADQVNIDDLPVPPIRPSGRKVAIVGAGPAGLAAANDLALEGHAVTVFEALPEPGGMLRYGIPEYRLPREQLRREIGYIRNLGVDIRTGVSVGRDISFLTLRSTYDAVFIGAGAQFGMRLDVEGWNLEGVLDGIRFLHLVNVGEKVDVGKCVAVIGGGDTAIDCARTAKRLGADDVRIIYRRSRAEMPAAKDEIEAAEKEGIVIDFLALPRKFSGESERVEWMECMRMKLGEPDASGRPKPVPIPGSEFVTRVDTVIAAIGQLTDLEFLAGSAVGTNKQGTIAIDRLTGATNVEGIFAGGDVVTGAAFVIDAIAAGKKAACAISRYLNGEPLERQEAAPHPEQLTVQEIDRLRATVPSSSRAVMKQIPPAERTGNFNEVALGFTPEQAISEARRCLAALADGCIECRECERRCDAKAINLTQGDGTLKLAVGAIILSPGYEVFNPPPLNALGFGLYPNVVNALQFERILSPTGPYGGHVLRPSDLKRPHRIAFIQCVGSRDHERDYCSSVCCMFATKEAIIAKEHAGEDVQCDIFFMDTRAFSKGFEPYIESAKRQGVRYIQCRIPVVTEDPGTRNLTISYLAEDDRKTSAEYDLIVLSVGMLPPRDAAKLAAHMGIELNQFGFCKTSAFHPVGTAREGIYVAGPFAEPKDIPETVMEASAAAANVLALLHSVRGTMITPRTFPAETDVTGQAPRIGVFVCHCGTNIAGVVNVQRVVEYARTLPDVVYAERNLYTCSNDTQQRIKQIILEHKLNRVVVASCTPRTHEALFRNTLREVGLNQYLFEMANIRDQCSWVHIREPENATHKAMDLVRTAIAKVRLDEPLYPRPLAISRDALVIGGGLAGMTAALGLANEGYGVHLVERKHELGGYLRHMKYTLTGEDPQAYLHELAGKAQSHPRISVHTDAVLREVHGSLGNFESAISTDGNGSVERVKHGVIIVATGAATYRPSEYLFGEDERVLLADELEERLASGEFNGNAVAFIQCVGSRNAERPYCSRTCCSESVKHALELKRRNPAAQVYVLYREMRTYGFRETYYSQARSAGVTFIRFADDRPPAIIGHNGKLSVIVRGETIGEMIELLVDNVVLAAATVPREENKLLAQMLKVPLSEDRFFLEAHRKLRPIDFATEGIFLCGNAHSPLGIQETVAQALGTAARAATILSKEEIQLEPLVSHVVEEKCDGCAYCVEPCPYKAITLVEYRTNGDLKRRVEVDEALCKGCGTCMATCPKDAIFVWHFRPEMLSAEVDAVLSPR